MGRTLVLAPAVPDRYVWPRKRENQTPTLDPTAQCLRLGVFAATRDALTALPDMQQIGWMCTGTTVATHLCTVAPCVGGGTLRAFFRMPSILCHPITVWKSSCEVHEE